jgi:hypothetical protein
MTQILLISSSRSSWRGFAILFLLNKHNSNNLYCKPRPIFYLVRNFSCPTAVTEVQPRFGIEASAIKLAFRYAYNGITFMNALLVQYEMEMLKLVYCAKGVVTV